MFLRYWATEDFAYNSQSFQHNAMWFMAVKSSSHRFKHVESMRSSSYVRNSDFFSLLNSISSIFLAFVSKYFFIIFALLCSCNFRLARRCLVNLTCEYVYFEIRSLCDFCLKCSCLSSFCLNLSSFRVGHRLLNCSQFNISCRWFILNVLCAVFPRSLKLWERNIQTTVMTML